MQEKKSFRFILMAAVAILIAAAPVAFACDETVRQQFLADVEAGVSADELEALYGHCRTAATTEDGTGKLLQITNTGNVFFEDMNGCGYNPQSETVSCDVEVKRNTGYGAFPTGSQEYVLFCFACGNAAFPANFFNAQFLATVHVTDDNASGGIPPYLFQASASTWSAPPACTANNGRAGTVRAILSWAVPPANCNANPIWGNRIDFTVRNDP